MNPLEAIRTLVEGFAEGGRVKQFGYDYKGKMAATDLANQSAQMENAAMPEKIRQAQALSQITLDTDAEKHAAEIQQAKDAGFDTTPEGLAQFQAAQSKHVRELSDAAVNAKIATEQAAAEAAKKNMPDYRPALSDTSLNMLGVPQAGANGPNPLPTNTDIAILTKKMEDEARLKQAIAAATLRVQGQQEARKTALTNKLQPLTDDNGNFTGKLIDLAGNIHENPALAGLRGKPLTGQVASRVQQAGVVMETGQMLIDSIPDVADKLGPIMGREFKLESLWGNPDPDIQKFATELASFAALQPALHGFRGQAALREFDRIIGGPQKSPQALAASIRGIMTVGGIIEKSGGLNARSGGGQPPPKGTGTADSVGNSPEDLKKKYGITY